MIRCDSFSFTYIFQVTSFGDYKQIQFQGTGKNGYHFVTVSRYCFARNCVGMDDDDDDDDDEDDDEDDDDDDTNSIDVQ